MKDFPFSAEKNGMLLLYNQFPRCYSSIAEMTSQLGSIAEMGFNAVWMNPLHLTGKEPFDWGQEKIKVKGSIYAMRDSKHFNPRFFTPEQPEVDETAKAQHNENEAKLKNYTAIAKSHNLIPIFDLVLNHVARDNGDDCPITSKYPDHIEENPTTFKDCRNFKYQDPLTKRIIKDELWKPFIEQYIKDYGFMGVRIDAVKKLERAGDLLSEICQYIDDCCLKFHGKNAIILGELLDYSPSKYVSAVRNKGLTHVNNNAFWDNYSHNYRKNWNRYSWLPNVILQLRQAVLLEQEEESSLLGGTIGYSGNHDEMSLFRAVSEIKLKGNLQESIVYLAREFLFGVAFTSDSGWYLLAGDEYLVDRAKPMVFDNFPLPGQPTFSQTLGATSDLRKYIRAINHALHSLPPASHWPADEKNFLIEHIAIDDLKNYGIIIRHTHPSGDEEDEGYLICVGLHPDPAERLQQDNHEGFLQGLISRPEIQSRNFKKMLLVDDGYVIEYLDREDLSQQAIRFPDPQPIADPQPSAAAPMELT